MSTPSSASDDEGAADGGLGGRAGADAAYGAGLDEVAELLRGQARAWAAQLRLVHGLDSLARRTSFGTGQFAQLEMAGSWLVGQLTATRWQDEAERFHDALPRTLAMLERGELLVHQAAVLLHRTRHCTAEIARAVEARVLPEGAGLVPSDLTRRVDRVVLQLESEQADGAAAEQRHADAAAQRRTFVKATQDGMGLAGAVLTAEQLVAWQRGLDLLERRERVADRAAGVVRTCEQRRADLFAAMPAMVLAGTAQDRAAQDCTGNDRAQDGAGTDRAGEGSLSGPVRPWTFGPEQLAAQIVFDVHVPVSTVLDLSRAPGTMDRYGPVSAEHVRLLRPHSWRRVLVDPDSGRPIAVDDRTVPVAADPEAARQQVLDMLRPEVVTDTDEPQHDPSARLARLVDLRDVHCCGPGCCSTRTDRDHLVPHPHGPTSAANLGRLSRRCHRAKHSGWLLVRHPDGSTTWTSPLGRTYDRPSPHAAPPHVDLTAPLPPLRARPHPSVPQDYVTTHGADAGPDGVAADAPDVEPDDGADDGADDDDPPPF